MCGTEDDRVATTSRWSLRNIYLYLVCLITLIMVIFATVSLVRSTVELLYPDPGYFGPVAVEKDGPTAEEIERSQDLSRRQSRRNAVLGLVGSAAMLLVAGPLYVYHWRKIESEKDIGPAEASPSSS